MDLGPNSSQKLVYELRETQDHIKRPHTFNQCRTPTHPTHAQDWTSRAWTPRLDIWHYKKIKPLPTHICVGKSYVCVGKGLLLHI